MSIALEQEHLVGARLYATRHDMLRAVAQKQGGVIAEIGVAHGDFSQFMLDTLRPKKFIAFDLFNMHEYPEHWGIPSEVLFNGMTHGAFYEERFKQHQAEIVMERGYSHLTLQKYPPRSFDLIYVDASHDYEGVKKDTVLSAELVKTDGLLIFNDYTMFDPITKTPYGVVQAVNELVLESDWRVIGFALQQDMFCDVALSMSH
ncbi:MAG: class I SAM-dependent methyltransferase [Hyphomicrobiaceae bacterium]